MSSIHITVNGVNFQVFNWSGRSIDTEKLTQSANASEAARIAAFRNDDYMSLAKYVVGENYSDADYYIIKVGENSFIVVMVTTGRETKADQSWAGSIKQPVRSEHLITQYFNDGDEKTITDLLRIVKYENYLDVFEADL